jgi:hypothetical protein
LRQSANSMYLCDNFSLNFLLHRLTTVRSEAVSCVFRLQYWGLELLCQVQLSSLVVTQLHQVLLIGVLEQIVNAAMIKQPQTRVNISKHASSSETSLFDYCPWTHCAQIDCNARTLHRERWRLIHICNSSIRNFVSKIVLIYWNYPSSARSTHYVNYGTKPPASHSFIK